MMRISPIHGGNDWVKKVTCHLCFFLHCGFEIHGGKKNLRRSSLWQGLPIQIGGTWISRSIRVKILRVSIPLRSYMYHED